MQDLQQQALTLSGKLKMLFPNANEPKISTDNSMVRINVQELKQDNRHDHLRQILTYTTQHGVERGVCVRRSDTGLVIIFSLNPIDNG